MNKEELLRRLEERLARSEISEKTYLDIKARYDAMPDLPPVPETPPTPEPSLPEDGPPPEGHAEHAGHGVRIGGNGDIGELINRTVESAMTQVAASLEGTLVNREQLEKRMEEVNRRIQEAVSRLGPRIEEGGRVCVIRGSGTVSGGQHFREFKCAGSGTVAGDLLADEAKISGACVIQGRCVGREFHAAGRAEIAGNVEVQEFHVSGKASVGGDVRAQEVHVSGSAKIGGYVEAQEVQLAGAIEVGGKVKTQEFASRGQFKIDGGIEAEEVQIRLAGASKVPTIKAKEIVIRRGERSGELTAESIEGVEVYLEATRAGLVRGHSVKLGPYCTVHTVEAQELEVHETATFKQRRAPTSDGETDTTL